MAKSSQAPAAEEAAPAAPPDIDMPAGLSDEEREAFLKEHAKKAEAAPAEAPAEAPADAEAGS